MELQSHKKTNKTKETKQSSSRILQGVMKNQKRRIFSRTNPLTIRKKQMKGAFFLLGVRQIPPQERVSIIPCTQFIISNFEEKTFFPSENDGFLVPPAYEGEELQINPFGSNEFSMDSLKIGACRA